MISDSIIERKKLESERLKKSVDEYLAKGNKIFKAPAGYSMGKKAMNSEQLRLETYEMNNRRAK